MKILDALASLDTADDAHWTSDGMPRMDVLQKLTGSPDLSRSQVINAAPDFTRALASEAEAPVPGKDDHVDTSPEADKEAKAPETVTDENPETMMPQPAGGEIMTPEVDPAVVAVEADQGQAVTLTPETSEIAPSAPTQPVPAPATKLEALQAALAVHTDAMNDADIIKKDADKAFISASDQVNTLNRQIDAITRADPHAATAGIRDYIAKQNEIRADRAARANKFMGITGAKPGDVAKVLEVRSPLDKAFLGRKAPRGSKRPQVRTPQG